MPHPAASHCAGTVLSRRRSGAPRSSGEASKSWLVMCAVAVLPLLPWVRVPLLRRPRRPRVISVYCIAATRLVDGGKAGLCGLVATRKCALLPQAELHRQAQAL